MFIILHQTSGILLMGVSLEAGFPQTVLGLLENHAESVKPAQHPPFPISVADLKIVKTAIGFLLNASVGYGGWWTCSSAVPPLCSLTGADAAKQRLISLEAAMTILKLSASIYPVGTWQQPPSMQEGRPSTRAVVKLFLSLLSIV